MKQYGHSFKPKYDYEIQNIKEFISEDNCEPEMIIHIQNKNMKIEKSFEVPTGFQLEKYARYSHPTNLIKSKYLNNDVGEKILKVDVLEKGEIIKRYLGFCQIAQEKI